eukprot:1768341-Pyramimonas_sp.AAC.1
MPDYPGRGPSHAFPSGSSGESPVGDLGATHLTQEESQLASRPRSFLIVWGGDVGAVLPGKVHPFVVQRW